MISLPPGCTVNYSIWIDIKQLDEEIVEWYNLIGGTVYYDRYWNSRGQEKRQPYVSYGKGKRCHYHHNGVPPGGVRLHFLGNDASVASMFILKFNDIIDNHNLQEVMERRDKEIG